MLLISVTDGTTHQLYKQPYDLSEAYTEETFDQDPGERTKYTKGPESSFMLYAEEGAVWFSDGVDYTQIALSYYPENIYPHYTREEGKCWLLTGRHPESNTPWTEIISRKGTPRGAACYASRTYGGQPIKYNFAVPVTDGTGNLLLIDNEKKYIYTFNEQVTNRVSFVRKIKGGCKPILTPKNDLIYLSEDNTVVSIDFTGNFNFEAPVPVSEGSLNHALANELVINPYGEIFVTTLTGYIVKLAGNGHLLQSVNIAGSPSSIASLSCMTLQAFQPGIESFDSEKDFGVIPVLFNNKKVILEVTSGADPIYNFKAEANNPYLALSLDEEEWSQSIELDQVEPGITLEITIRAYPCFTGSEQMYSGVTLKERFFDGLRKVSVKYTAVADGKVILPLYAEDLTHPDPTTEEGTIVVAGDESLLTNLEIPVKIDYS